MNAPDSAHWSDYWAAGHVTSLPQDFAGNYDGEIRAFWEGQFAAAPLDARVLDLCTGNGAVAMLAVAWARANDAAFEVTALDAATLDPAMLARQHPRAAHLVRAVRFIGGTPLERCKLPTGTFDLVTSQYGIEYCHLEEAAAQIERLLKPGGTFCMLTHASDSEILVTMQAENDEYALLEASGLFSALDSVVDGRFDLQSLSERLAEVEEQIGADTASPLFANVLQLVRYMKAQDAEGFDTHHAQLARARDRLRHARGRLADMLRVNRMMREDPDWHRVFERHGLLPMDSGEILYRGRHRSGRFHGYRKPAHGEEH